MGYDIGDGRESEVRVFAACKLRKVPDHSWLSKKRSHLQHEVDEKVFER